ncbi:uncharacterized protein BcabD6B2_43280 [Babesia caballi]|uniref:Membrane protein, putative n=1 Tax=Babesia caballi TaxID=5871 RepID=A0AAV4LYU2_BABCB|nr:membrane protein, putative [Babesia caballi]
MTCEEFMVDESSNLLSIHFIYGISIRIDTSSISGGESLTRIPVQRSETSAYADETKRIARSVVESAPCYPRGDDQGASGSSSQQQPGRYIYLLVPRNVTEPTDIEKYVTHDANWNTVTYDVRSILRMMVTGKERDDEPLVHNVYLTARLVYVREDSSIVFCTPKSSATAEPPSTVMDTDLAYPSTSYVGTAEITPSNVERSRASQPAVVEPSYVRVEREASISGSSRSVPLVVDTDADDSEASDDLEICEYEASTPESDDQAASRGSASASVTASGSHGDGVSVIAGQAIGERSGPISAPTDANPDGSQVPPELMRRAEALPLPQLLYRLGPYFNSNLELLVAADYNVMPPPDNRTVAIRRTFKNGVWYTHFAVPPQLVSDYRIAGVVDSRIESQPLFQEPAGALQTTVESFVFSHIQWHYVIVQCHVRGEPAPTVVRRVYAQQVYESHVIYNTLSDMEADVIMRYMNAFRP